MLTNVLKQSSITAQICVFVLFSCFSVWAQNPSGDTLSFRQILANAESVEKTADSISNETTIRFEQHSILKRLNKDGSVKSTDTTIFIITKKGEKELSRKILFSSTGETNIKKTKKREQNVDFDLNDPNYKFSLKEQDSLSYVINVKSKSRSPKKGEYEGMIIIDKENSYTKRVDFIVPKPDGKFKEFSINTSYKIIEGGIVVPSHMQMNGFISAMMGVVKIRMAVEVRYSNYEIVTD